MTTETRKAWAIDISLPEKAAFYQVLWFRRAYNKPFNEGIRVAFFSTREQARGFMESYDLKGIYPKARVVRVVVTVTTDLAGDEG